MARDNVEALVEAVMHSPEHKASLSVRASLMFSIVGHLKENKIRKDRIPESFKLSRAAYSDLMESRVDAFTIEDLVRIAANAGLQVSFAARLRGGATGKRIRSKV